MSEEIKEAKTEEQKKQEAAAEEAAIKDPVELFSHGKYVLTAPIHSNNKEFTELEYDFRSLKGWEYAECMDRDIGTRNNTFNMTNKQAINLFAAAAAKKTAGIDAADIRRDLSTADAVKVAQISVTFFVACTQEGNKRITTA